MIYNNPMIVHHGLIESLIYTCVSCGLIFEKGERECEDLHYGKGCCHYLERVVWKEDLSYV